MNHSDISIAQIMRPVQTILIDVDFKTALAEMIKQKTNSLVVVDEHDEYKGLLTARIFIEHAIPSYISTDEILAHYANEDLFRETVSEIAHNPVKTLLERNIETIKSSDSVMKAAVIATKNQQIRIPVLNDENKPIGLLTRTEIKQLIGTFLGIDNCFDDILSE